MPATNVDAGVKTSNEDAKKRALSRRATWLAERASARGKRPPANRD